MIHELKPCPFCGGDAMFHEHERVGVECIECGAGFACVYRDRGEAAEAILTASRPGDRHAARASYCPSCGARVAEEKA